MKLKLCFLLLLCLFFRVYAQEKILPARSAVCEAGIAIGQQVPDMVIRKVSGLDVVGRDSTVALSAFRGKLVILDFWATWCAPCIAGFPKMNTLQKKYRNDLQVILVNNEPVSRAAAFLEKRKKEHGEAFGAVLADTLLNKTFPHRTVPHYVWIGRDGKVLAITGEEELEEAKLLKAMSGEGSAFVNKKNIDPRLPLFSSADFPDDGLVRYSLLSKGRVSGLASGTQFRKAKFSGVLIGRAFTNADFFHLYGTVGRVLQHELGERFSDKQIRYIGADSSGFLHDSYNYEFVVPERFSGKLYPMMLDDLNTYSPYVGRFETEVGDCLVLEHFGDVVVRLNGSHDMGISAQPDKGAGSQAALNLKNATLEALADHLENLSWNSLLVVNKTGISGRISIRVDEADNLEQVNAGLRFYGLRLRRANKKMEVLIIRDRMNEQTKQLK